MFSRTDCTNSPSKIDKEDVIVDDISKADTFIIGENGTLIQIFPETEVNLGDPNLSINLNFSEAEALSAVEQLEDHDYNITTHGEHDDSLSETFFCEVVSDNIITIETEENNSVNNTESVEEIEQAENLDKDISQDILKPKRRKRHQVTEDDWEYKKAKILREQGKEYKGRIVIDGKVMGIVSRPERTMKEVTCKCTGKTFHCKTLTETERQKIFNDFWKLSWKERKIFIKTMTDVNVTQRSRDRKIENLSRRKFSFKFHLYVNKSKKVRVCKKSLLATLGIGEWMVNNWLEGGGEDHVELTEEDETDERTENKRQSKKITKQEDLNERCNLLKEFLLALPNVESHYCRAGSQKLYLESCWTSKVQLFQFYTDNWCKEKNCKPLSSCTFHKTFEDLNLSLYRPKKDQCDVCRAHKLKHITDEEYDDHSKKKTAARQEKDKDKENEQHIYTIDLQSLLLCPKSNASALYYRRKLSVHNLCVYDLKTHDGFCYLWNETEGELTANEFASILSHFIQSQLPLRNNAKKIVIFSDGCNYQNRSSILSNAMLHLSVRYKICIESKYLEKGHTQMECDSMHATIERYLRQRDIHVPADYVEVCKNARKHPRPYKVTYLEHSFFKQYTKPIMYKSIRPGLKKGDAKVTDIRCLKYSDDGKIYYKLNFEDEFKLLPACEDNTKQTEEASRKSRRKRQDPEPSTRHPIDKMQAFHEADFPNLYNSRLKITEAKYNHLQELKMTIPGDYHCFYDELPF